MVTFGANTTATFGKGTPAAGGFSFNASGGAGNGFGSTPATPSTPKAGSSPAPAFGGFGTPAPAAPAPAAGGGLFGAAAPAPAAPAPAAPAPAAGGFGFGSSAPAPAAAGGLFGSSATPAPAPAATGGLFGAPAAAAPAAAAGGFGFGLGAPAPAAPAAAVPTAATAAASASASVTLARRQESARLEAGLLSLHSQYNPRVSDPSHLIGTTPHHAQLPSSQCRFQYVFYDPMTTEQRQSRLLHGPHHLPPRPPHVDAKTWAEAVACNPDPNELIPVVLVGAEELIRRMNDQNERSKTYAEYCTQLKGHLSDLKVQMAKSDDATRAAQRDHAALRSRLLKLMRRVEIVRCTNLPLQVAEREAAERVEAVRRGVDAVGRALADVEERGRHHVHALRSMAAAGGAGGGGGGGMDAAHRRAGETVSEQGLAELHALLARQRVGMDELSAIVQRDARDATIAREEFATTAAGGFGGGGAGGAMRGQPLGLPAPYPTAGSNYRAY